MVLDGVTLKQSKTHCGRALIMDPIVHIVTDADADLEQNQPSGAESIKMRVSLSTAVDCVSDIQATLLICVAT